MDRRSLDPTMCPTCRESIDIYRVHISRLNSDGQLVPTEGYRNLKSRKSDGTALDDLALDQYLTCSNGHEIPEDALYQRPFSIALVGTTRSMKSHFIATVTHALIESEDVDFTMRGDRERSTYAFSATPPTVIRLERDYWSKFTARRSMDRTQTAVNAVSPIRSPFILHCRKLDGQTLRPTIHKMHKSNHILLFDAPGESFEDANRSARLAPFLLDADSIAFFVDVGQVSALRPFLPAEAYSDDAELNFHSRVLDQCARLLRSPKRMPWRYLRPLERPPVTLVLTKADLLLHGTGALKSLIGSGLDRPNSMTMSDNQVLARRIAESYLGSSLQHLRNNFADVQVMLASAMGSYPVDGAFPPAVPWGCADVLRSLLDRAGYR